MPADGNRTTSFDREIPSSFFVFDVLRSWDLPQLLASTSAQGLIVNPIDGDGDRLSERPPSSSCRARFASSPPRSPTKRSRAFSGVCSSNGEPPHNHVSRASGGLRVGLVKLCESLCTLIRRRDWIKEAIHAQLKPR